MGSYNNNNGTLTPIMTNLNLRSQPMENYVTQAQLLQAMAEKQDVIQYETLPQASASLIDEIVQYVGVTSGSYTNGYFYKCVSNGEPTPTYYWQEVSLGGGGTAQDTTSCDFVNESEYVACVGAQCNIYFDNICKTHNNSNIYFTASSSNNSIPITVFEERFAITPVAANVGTSTITVKAKRKDTAEEIATTTFTLRVVAKTVLPRNVRVILIGDSITNGGWNYNLPNMMNITFYGTLGTSPRNHEGRVSWKASDYCTQQSYNGMTNPFYNPNKSGSIKFDFAYYIENHPTFADVDYVNIMLGRNDGYTQSCVDYIQAMVDNILTYNNDIRVTVSYGFQRGYQAWEKDRSTVTYNERNHVFAFDEMLQTAFQSYTRVDLIPTFINTDNIYDHGVKTQYVSTRNTTFTYPVYVADAIHFITQGYYKIGDVYYNYLNYLTNKYPLPVDPSVVDKTVLETQLTSANALINNTVISVDGTDVASNLYWVTQAVHDTYANAIASAQAVDDDTEATQVEVDEAVANLASATTVFDSAKQEGTATPSVIRPDNRKYYVTIHNKTKDTYLYISEAWGYTSDGGYYPTQFRVVKNTQNNKVYFVATMGGTAASYAWYQYTSNDGATWSDKTTLSNVYQIDITSIIGINDKYEIIDQYVHE